MHSARIRLIPYLKTNYTYVQPIIIRTYNL